MNENTTGGIFLKDGIHLSHDGYGAMGDLWFAAVKPQYAIAQLKAGVQAYQTTHPKDRKVTIIDLGKAAGRAFDDKDYWSGLHPNSQGHAVFATRLVAEMQATLLKPQECFWLERQRRENS